MSIEKIDKWWDTVPSVFHPGAEQIMYHNESDEMPNMAGRMKSRVIPYPLLRVRSSFDLRGDRYGRRGVIDRKGNRRLGMIGKYEGMMWDYLIVRMWLTCWGKRTKREGKGIKGVHGMDYTCASLSVQNHHKSTKIGEIRGKPEWSWKWEEMNDNGDRMKRRSRNYSTLEGKILK